MSRRGQVFENPVTGERAVIITDPLEHPQGVLVAELHVEPGGRVVAGPVTDREEILYAEIDPDAISAGRREFDPVGHYARPDVFHLTVDTAPRPPVSFLAP